MPERLLDSNAIIAAMAGTTTFDRYLSALGPRDRLLTSVTVEGELRFGLARLPVGQRRERLSRALRSVLTQLDAVLPVTHEVAGRYGRLKAELWAGGEPMGENDLWIAATALAHGCVLVTADRAFHSVPSLRVEDWSQS